MINKLISSLAKIGISFIDNVDLYLNGLYEDGYKDGYRDCMKERMSAKPRPRCKKR